MRTVLIVLLVAIAIVIIVYAIGPRVEVDTTLTFDEKGIGQDPERYLSEIESRFEDIRPGLEKEIIWANPASRLRTPLAIVYIHGFSASKGEVRPLPDIVAGELGANLFYTRLAGHGRSQAAMGEASVNAWVNDLAEAIAVGRAIGERIVVIATSTGGTLASWGAAQPGLMRDVTGLVLLSPNFGTREEGGWMLLLPWGETLARWRIGETRGFEPSNELVRHYWTYRYPVTVLPTLVAMVTLARAQPFENVTIPALFFVSDGDKTVLPGETRRIAARWGADHQIVTVENTEDPGMHVIAGDAVSPSTTRSIADRIVAWVRERR